MVCLYCGGKTRVTNSRAQKRTSGVWRRHLCVSCGAIFSSLERVDYSGSLSFQDAMSHIAPFDQSKLFISLYEACKHRTEAISDALGLTDTIMSKLLRGSQQKGLITRQELIVTAIATLKAFDHAARVYYAAYHPAKSVKS